MALLNIGEDPWLREFESCEKLHRDIMELLTQRQHLSRQCDKYNQISSTIRLWLKQFNNELGQLNQKLTTTTKAGSITAAESERRSRQLEILQSKSIQMKQMFDEQVTAKVREERDRLIGQSSSWKPDEDVSSCTVDELRNDQRRMLGEQEQGLESLSQIISRQKNIAQSISGEVDLHNEILEDLGIHIDRTDNRVRDETQSIAIVDRKDNTCIYWVIIILLFLSIIVVWTS